MYTSTVVTTGLIIFYNYILKSMFHYINVLLIHVVGGVTVLSSSLDLFIFNLPIESRLGPDWVICVGDLQGLLPPTAKSLYFTNSSFF